MATPKMNAYRRPRLRRSRPGPRLQSTTAATGASARRPAPGEPRFPARAQSLAPSSGSRGWRKGSAALRTSRRKATTAKCAIQFASDADLDRQARALCVAREIVRDHARLRMMATVALRLLESVDKEQRVML